jgi:hypothetical protein
MRIYSHKIYRQIYKKHIGPIPSESNGRTYEIHHIDGNHNNNNPSNLKAVTVKEHYDIHYAQGDYNACVLMSFRMNLEPEELSALRSKAAYTRVENGTYPWTDKEKMKKQNQKRTAEGKNAFSNPDIVKQQIANGTHATTKRVSCLGCKKETYVSAFNKWHTKCSP